MDTTEQVEAIETAAAEDADRIINDPYQRD